jgi:hypothetical protein
MGSVEINERHQQPSRTTLVGNEAFDLGIASQPVMPATEGAPCRSRHDPRELSRESVRSDTFSSAARSAV